MTTTEIIRKLCKEHGISVTNLEEKLGCSNGSLSKSSTNALRSDRLLAIAKYFNVSMEFLMGSENIRYDEETHTWNVDDEYYLNDKTKEVAQFYFDNPDHRVLFDASRKVKPEDLQKALKALGLFIDEE